MPTSCNQKVHTVLTGVETITGRWLLCMAIPTSKKGATKHQLTQLKKFVMEKGFGGSIIQVGNEPSTTAGAQTTAKELTIPWRTSAPHEHQSQGAIERFHKTLFAQVSASRFDLVDRDGACRCEAHYKSEAGNSQSRAEDRGHVD
eukprot:4585980-Amphidinium_carterae.4